ncbi:hypothetical protein AAG747_27800 [Rapidithrix thailandica]|uniref:Helix-turn-helix domain-containing protein n=1 Tax=Rapidithrix thailandica TaxID=413964 RepID=A0AAW9SEE8_9BACT
MISKSQLAMMYKVSLPTMRKMLRELGFEKGKRLFKPKDVAFIIRQFGPPKNS